jgi:hypothetical protein
LELPLVFHEQSATLTAEDKRHLDEVAQLLKSKEARELRLVVSDLGGRTSGPQRAKAVVDYLDRHGIARERLEVGSGQGRGGAGGGGLVQLDVVGPGAPVAGVQAADQAQRR